MKYSFMHCDETGWPTAANAQAAIREKTTPSEWRVVAIVEMEDAMVSLIPIGTQVFVATTKGVLKGVIRSTVVTTNADGQKVVYRYSYGANDNGDAYPQYVFTDPMEAFRVMEEIQK